MVYRKRLSPSNAIGLRPVANLLREPTVTLRIVARRLLRLHPKFVPFPTALVLAGGPSLWEQEEKAGRQWFFRNQ